jgi:hypothetical protein
MQVRRLSAGFELTTTIKEGKVKLPLRQRLAIKSARLTSKNGEVFGGTLNTDTGELELVESGFWHKQLESKKIPVFRFPAWMRKFSKLGKVLSIIEKIISVPIDPLERFNAPQQTYVKLNNEQLKQLLAEPDTIDLTNGVRTGKYLVLILHENKKNAEKPVLQVMSAATAGSINKQHAKSPNAMKENVLLRQKGELGIEVDPDDISFKYHLTDGSMNHLVPIMEYGAEVLGTFANRTDEMVTGRLILPATLEAFEAFGEITEKDGKLCKVFEHNGHPYTIWDGISMIAREEWGSNN